MAFSFSLRHLLSLATVFIFFAIAVPVAEAGNTVSVNTGESMKTIAWSVVGGSPCIPTTAYPNSADGIRASWIASNKAGVGSTNFGGVNVAAAAGTYTFTCEIPGPVSDTATLLVCNNTTHESDGGSLCVPKAPTIVTFDGPTSVVTGTGPTLTWTTTNATACTINQGVGAANPPASGSRTAPAIVAATTYTLSCMNGATGPVTDSVTVGVTAAPSLTFTATPPLIGPGDSTTLTWTATGFTSCTASGGWAGPKAFSGTNNQTLSPAVTTSYTLTCTGPGGPDTRTVNVTLPSGSIAANSCTIVAGNPTCNTNVAWNSSNFLGAPEILQSATVFSNSPSSVGTSRAVSPTDNVFTLRDSGSSFTTTVTAVINCAVNSVWIPTLNICAPLPDISIIADPNVIRSGQVATLEIEIDALYDLACTLRDGGAPATFSHNGSASPQTYTRLTRPLTSAQMVSIECTAAPLYPTVTGTSEVRVNVVPTIQEI